MEITKLIATLESIGFALKGVNKAAAEANEVAKTLKELGKTCGLFGYGFIEKRIRANIEGQDGWLIWDYIVWNEITFEADNGLAFSIYHNMSKEKTALEWYKSADKYGKE